MSFDKDKPQYFTIANNIWKTINNPVSTQMIKGVIDFDEVSKVAKALTPVPGGVGPMTIACLLKNTIDCFKRSQK